VPRSSWPTCDRHTSRGRGTQYSFARHSPGSVAAQIGSDFGQVNVLVNCGGVTKSVDQWESEEVVKQGEVKENGSVLFNKP
jgi:hypothetical protein